MNKFLKKLIALLAVLFLAASSLSAQTSTGANQGKIVIVILDVSGSIKKQFPDIKKILDKTIIKDRLNVGDYFVLIPFGDKATPMYSGKILREEDKNAISNTLKAMKANNDYTDIGQAIKTALTDIVNLKQQNFNLYEPMVLFITDGDITTDRSSPFYGQNVDQIFQDPLISNTPLFNGWYYVGIGKDLHDLPEIARKSGREKYLLRIEDLANFESMLDDWISNIPPSQPLEQGEVFLDNFKLGNYKLKEGKTCDVADDVNKLSFNIGNNYRRTSPMVEITDVRATFQTEDKSMTIPVKVDHETGKIMLTPSTLKTSDCSFIPGQKLEGKGTVKFNINANINGVPREYNKEFKINSRSAGSIMFSNIFWPVLIILLLILFFVLLGIARKFLPVRVTMEIVGQPSLKFKTIKAKINKKIEFGSKPGLAFKLDVNQFGPVVGQLQRTGAKKWQIIPRDRAAFEDGSKNIPYALNTVIRLKNRDGDDVAVKFKLKK